MNWLQVIWLAIGFLLGATVLKRAFPLAHRFGLTVRFWFRHGRKGKKILFVYSDSSNWKDYIEKNILPRIQSRSIVLNWSKRREWGTGLQLETKLFEQLAGHGKFVPVAILFSPIGKVKIFRLWHLSANSKQGKARISKETEQAFFETLKRLSPASA